MLYLLVFLLGATLSSWVIQYVLNPWARRGLGRPLECDLWGLEDVEIYKTYGRPDTEEDDGENTRL